MNQDTPFSEADAVSLRKWALALDETGFSVNGSAAGPSTPPELQRYLTHYGFTDLFELDAKVTHSLYCHHSAGYDIVQHHWARPNTRATVIVVHGLFDHTGLYLKLVQRLLEEGFSVVSFDLPGHGLSSGQRVSINDFKHYSAVLDSCIAFCQDALPGPCFAVGQSTGCSAIMHLLIDTKLATNAFPGNRVLRKVVLLAPLVRIRSWTRVVLIHTLLQRFIKRVPRRFGANSHDEQFLDFLDRADPLQTRHVDVPWVQAMRSWVKTFEQAPTMNSQVLVIQGTADATVDWHWNIPLIQQKFPEARVHYVKAGLHHLVNEAEPWRGEVLDTLCRFLED